MLEKVAKDREAQLKALKSGGSAPASSKKETKDDKQRPGGEAHNSFLEVEGEDDAKKAARSEKSAPPPPEEILPFGVSQAQQQNMEEMQQQYSRFKAGRVPELARPPPGPSPTPNHNPPSIPTPSKHSIQNPDNTAPRFLADQQPLPQPAQQEWSSTFRSPEKAQPSEEPLTKPTSGADGWDFNESTQFSEQENKTGSQRPDTDVFPPAQDPPKSPVRGPGSHRRKTSLSRRKSGEHELSLNPTQRPDSGSFKVRFGLRGHLDVVRSVIFTGGGSPGEPELCTAGDDGTVKRWIIPARYEDQGSFHVSPNDLDIQSYFTHRGHAGPVMCLTSWSPSQNFSSGGRAQGDGWIFSGGQDATVRSNAFGGPDRIILASGAADGTVKLLQANHLPSVSYSDAAVLVYDTRTGEELPLWQVLETYDGTHSTGVNAIVATTTGLDGSLSSDSNRGMSEDENAVGGATGTSGGVEGIIISGHEDRFIRFYDANSGQCTYNMLAHPAAISALSLSPDGHELVSSGHDASLRFWSLDTRSCTQEITSHRLMRGEGVCSVVWSQDGRWISKCTFRELGRHNKYGGDMQMHVWMAWVKNSRN
ncbi:hypothetical protein DID88_003066 [Monilinia fructigena]|uniref:Uncharacterized protein n=1 Tax=Monilinia fructigena TaxID=38457 RepID=A0A395IJY2_9HELO|nr:hypothetical protein DID88_003066 [Monilinia fructigena]